MQKQQRLTHRLPTLMTPSNGFHNTSASRAIYDKSVGILYRWDTTPRFQPLRFQNSNNFISQISHSSASGQMKIHSVCKMMHCMPTSLNYLPNMNYYRYWQTSVVYNPINSQINSLKLSSLAQWKPQRISISNVSVKRDVITDHISEIHNRWDR